MENSDIDGLKRLRTAEGGLESATTTRLQRSHNVHRGRFSSGYGAGLEEMLVDDPPTYATALDLLGRTATEPSFLGVAGDLLYAGRTPGNS